MTPIAIAVVVLPLLVSVVICAVARREGLPMPAGPLTRLFVATVVAAVSSLLFSRMLLAAVAMFAVLFIAFAIPVMQALERSAGARMRVEDTRSALLVPRTVGAYVSLPARAALAVAALASLAWVVVRAMTAAPRMTMLLSFTVAGLTFLGLYEAWLRQEVFDVRAIDEEDRRLRVRAVFAAQSVLSLSFLLMAALSAEPWPGRSVLAVAATIIGGIGCAFALSTGIQQRYLEAWTRGNRRA